MDSDRFVVAQPQRLPAYYECGSVVAGCCCTGALLAAARGPARARTANQYHIKIHCNGRAQQNRATAARGTTDCASLLEFGTSLVRCPDRPYT